METQYSSSPEDMFGRYMREVRELRGLSQQQLADELKHHGIDLHASAIAKMEARDVPMPRGIRLGEAVAISQILGVTLEEMLRPGQEVQLLEAAVARQREVVDIQALGLANLEETLRKVRARHTPERFAQRVQGTETMDEWAH